MKPPQPTEPNSYAQIQYRTPAFRVMCKPGGHVKLWIVERPPFLGGDRRLVTTQRSHHISKEKSTGKSHWQPLRGPRAAAPQTGARPPKGQRRVHSRAQRPHNFAFCSVIGLASRDVSLARPNPSPLAPPPFASGPSSLPAGLCSESKSCGHGRPVLWVCLLHAHFTKSNKAQWSSKASKSMICCVVRGTSFRG